MVKTIRPNVLLIVADDMGYGDLRCFGNPFARTPALDQLARDGLCLLQHYSGSPVCAPARASLLTGRYPHRTGVIDTREVRGLDRLSLREATLADRLAGVGYATGLVGKWHLGSLDRRYSPNARGFQEYMGFHGAGSDYWDYRLYYDDKPVKGKGQYLTDHLTDRAVSFIERHANEPFFLEVAYNAPHIPLQAPEGMIDLFPSGELKDTVRTIYAMIACLDAGIARLLETLERLRLVEDTIVLFVSDNGPDMSGSADFSGEPNPDFVRFNGHFQGSKGLVFEGGIRVPGILRWPGGLPGGLPGGRQLNDVIHFIDWVPTLLDMVAAPADPSMGLPADGQSLLSVLRGEATMTERRLCWQWNRYAPVRDCNAAIRSGQWKLVRPRIAEAMKADPRDSAMDRSLRGESPAVTEVLKEPLPERDLPAPQPPMLFDLAADPYELHDVAGEHPARIAKMAAELDNWFEDVERERRAIPS